MNSVWKSIAGIWNSLSVGQRVMLGATTGLTIAILIGLIWWSQKPQLSLLAAGLDPVEAAKISDELRDQKIPFEVTGAGRTIYVPDNMVYDLRFKLLSKGVLKANGQSGVGFELFDKPQFGMSDFMQKASYYRALQGELARTIMQMQEVEAARVFIVVPNDRLFSADKSEAKASVFLTLRSGGRLGRQQINAIRYMVANGVEGLKPTKVTISDNSGGVLAPPDEDQGSELTSTQLETRRGLETLYNSKVQTMLDQVLGLGQSVVRTTIDMNFDNVTETREQFDPASVIRTESTNVEDSENSTPSTGGVAGTVPNIPGSSTNATARTESASVGKSKKQITNNQYEISKTVQNTLKGVGDIKKVSVAVLLNQTLGQDGKPIVRSKDEMAKLQNIIKKAVGAVEEKGKRMDEIVVEEVVFAPLPPGSETALALAPVKQLTDPGNYDKYINWAKNIGLVLLALYLLSFFRKMLTESKGERLRTELNLDEIMEGDKVDRKSQNITVGELSKLIRENPNNMAQSLKNWLGPT